MPEKSRSGRLCKNHSFSAFSWLPVPQERKRLASPCVTKLGHDGGKCLSLRKKFVYFLLSQLCTETGRFCPAHATRTAQRAEQLTVHPLTLLLISSPFLDLLLFPVRHWRLLVLAHLMLLLSSWSRFLRRRNHQSSSITEKGFMTLLSPRRK